MSITSAASNPALSVQDDSGRTVSLSHPAQRVISLAPHVTELLFAAGGGKQLVGVVSYSDFPPEAKAIQNVGDNRQWDMERIIALKPDLLVVWQHGNSERQIDALRKLGVPLFYSEPKKLDDIANSIEKLGILLGTQTQATSTAQAWREKLNSLRTRYAKKQPVRMFYQVWDKPLFTLNGKHIVSDAMQVCGGENIFASLPITAPNVSIESVIKENPEAIFSGDQSNQSGGKLTIWQPYKSITAVRRGNLFAIDGDLLSRSGPRMLQGTELICEKLEIARKNRKGKP